MPSPFQEKAKLLREKNDQRKKFWDDRDKKIAEDKKADPDAPADLQLSADDKKLLDTLHGELKDLNAEVEEFKEYETIAGRAEALLTVLGKPNGAPDYGNIDPKNPPVQAKSMGAEFCASDAYKRLMKDIMPTGTGQVPDGMKIHSEAFELKGLVYSAATSGGAFIRREYAEPEGLPLRPLTIRQLITNSRTGSNLIEFVRQTAKTRAADVIPEATATSGGGYTAAAKPEAGMTWEVVQVGVKTIPVWMPITRQVLADVPQLESEINGFLVDDIELKFEEEIISGVGGTHFTGLENTVGLTPQAFATDMITTTRKARTTAQIVAREVSTGFLMNPLDWEELDLTKDGQNRYYWGGPTTLGQKMLWGLPVAESEVIPQKTAYTGNLKKIQVWDREQPTLRVTDSHADFFTHNLIAILCEMRAAMGVKRPAAIVKIDLLAGANS